MSSRAALKAFFNTGDRPTEPQFADLIDSLAHLLDDYISQAEAEAGTATTPRTWSALRVKQAIDALASGLPAGYELFWVILRNTGSGWFGLNDTDHTPSPNIASVTNDTQKIVINFTKTFAEVGSVVVGPDEDFVNTHRAGSSGLLNAIHVFLSEPFPNIAGRLLFSGGVWSAASLQATGAMTLSGTFPNFTITHLGDDCASNPPFFVQANTRLMNPNTDQTISATNTKIYLDPAYVPVDSHRLFFQRTRRKEGQFIPVNPNSAGAIGALKNFWVIGLMKN